MTAGGLRSDSSPAASIASPLWESLPMLLLTIALFAAGYLLLWMGVDVGPPALPLWALLLVLGFVASIGTAVSWFFGEVTQFYGDGEEGSESGFGRSPDAGRPRPQTRAGARSGVGGTSVELEPWDEGPVPALPVEEASGAAPVGPGRSPRDAGRVLEEIDGIEREVAPRRKTGEPSSR